MPSKKSPESLYIKGFGLFRRQVRYFTKNGITGRRIAPAFLFLPKQYQEYCTQENCQLFVQWRVGFFCVKDDCRFGESFIKARLSLRLMEWQLFAFVEIEKNLSPGPQPLVAIFGVR